LKDAAEIEVPEDQLDDLLDEKEFFEEDIEEEDIENY
jgi:hypothetical protein